MEKKRQANLLAIAKILQDIRTRILNGECPQLPLPSRPLKLQGGAPIRDIKRFTCIVKLLKIIEVNICGNVISTKRDIFYRDISLFGSQQYVDSLIQQVQLMLNCERLSLNIVASPKGLVCGDMTIYQEDEISIDIKGITLIPVAPEILFIRFNRPVDFVLVVEKEAVFRNMCIAFPNAIVITGKGVPDYITRKLICIISRCHPDIPIYTLVDADPYGLQIVFTYQTGGIKADQERKSLALSSIKFLGASIIDYRDESLPATVNDRRKAMSLLKMGVTKGLQREVQLQLFICRKAELNVLNNTDSVQLHNYVKRKLTTKY
uniref:DNA topoisomerase (ATP-hydrolyzing) n=1 Tax=Blastobotrys adeninivorans TaxID=409370 RepID=A0A060T4E7_BLAAD